MDLQMPEMTGVDAIMAICGEFPRARIIVLTTYTGDVQVLRALKAGAAHYAPEVRRTLFLLQADTGKSLRELLGEAINDL